MKIAKILSIEEHKGFKGWLKKIYNKYLYKKHCCTRKVKMLREVNKNDWDYTTFYSLIATKLENILDYASKDSVTYIESWYPDKIRVAISLARHLSGEKEHYPEYINNTNINRFVNEIDMGYFNFHHEDKPFEGWKCENMKNILGADLDRIDYEELYNIKAKSLLFEILKNYINNWWD